MAVASSSSSYPVDADSAIRVVVTPSQSSYFAGEPFSVTITFTNTRSPESSSAPSRHAHKRGAHSVSSAPLARPPTSPGTPRTALLPPTPTQEASGGAKIARKGLIGKKPSPPEGAEELPDVLEQSRKRLLAKSRSLSVAITSSEVPQAETMPMYVRAYDDVVVAPESTPSPSFGRSPTLPLHHPHARKQSIFDGQIQIPRHPQTHSPLASPYTSSASTSTFSLSLDSIAESSPPSLSPTNGRRPPLPHTNSELILYSYAQLTGTLSVISPLPPSALKSEQARTLNALRAKLLKRAVVGGGSMDITSSLHTPRARSAAGLHRRSTSFSSGLLSFISSPSAGYASGSMTPTPTASAVGGLTSTSTPSLALSASQSWSPMGTRPRGLSHSVFAMSPSTPKLARSNSGLGISGVDGGGLENGTAGGQEEEVDPETPLPTFEVPQVMLAVDLSLGPGESRSYTYTLPLPANLPPTFKGRALRFSYEFAVGTCRAGAGTGAASNSVSRVMKVPIRVYNHVAVGQVQRPYDLLWPVARRRAGGAKTEGAVVTEVELASHKPHLPPLLAPKITNTALGIPADLREYAKRLLASFPAPGAGTRARADGNEHPHPVDVELEREELDEEGGLTGCREAVEILTRIPKKASYDVHKDGVKVAELTFTKSAYRLGETVLGVVELNERTSRARVLSMSALLETHESLPSSISPPSTSKLRRVLAEHHCSFVLSSLRTTFALDIPSDASPAFQVQIGADVLSPPGGLEWKVRLCLLVAVASEASVSGPEGVRIKHMVRDGARGEWGSSWKACASIAPMERPDREAGRRQTTAQTWGQFFASSFLGSGESGYHDGDAEDEDEEADGLWDGEGESGEERDFGGGRSGWRDLKVETVECEVPIKVWPGNTAFKAMEVVFDV